MHSVTSTARWPLNYFVPSYAAQSVFCRNTSSFCLLSTSVSTDGFTPDVIRFLNQDAWNRGVLLELVGESGEPWEFEVAPSRNW